MTSTERCSTQGIDNRKVKLVGVDFTKQIVCCVSIAAVLGFLITSWVLLQDKRMFSIHFCFVVLFLAGQFIKYCGVLSVVVAAEEVTLYKGSGDCLLFKELREVLVLQETASSRMVILFKFSHGSFTIATRDDTGSILQGLQCLILPELLRCKKRKNVYAELIWLRRIVLSELLIMVVLTFYAAPPLFILGAR